MCPGMCFGIAGVFNAPCDRSRLTHTLNAVTYAHPFLRAVIGYEQQSDRYFYDITDESKTRMVVHDETVNGPDDKIVRERFERAVRVETDLFKDGMLRIFVWGMGDKTCALFVFHHLLADGRGALGLVSEFADMYVDGIKPNTVEEQLISSPDDLPLGAEFSGMNRTLINMFNKKWIHEGSRYSYEQYHDFASKYQNTHSVKYGIQVYEKDRLSDILEQCHQQGVTLNDYLLAQMFEKQRISKIIIASDLRSKLDCYRTGALGNYSTAFTVKLNRRGRSVWKLARCVHSEVRNIISDIKKLCLVLSLYCVMEPGLIDGAAAAALGGWNSKAASSVGKNVLGLSRPEGHSITNLGKLESKTLAEAMFIPPASPAIKMTQGVLTVNGKMYICTSER